MIHLLLDYDGFICKAFYASMARGNNSIEDANLVLKDLTNAAIEKGRKIDKQVQVKKVVSGHTYKKDIYPNYKSKRSSNEFLGIFREYVINNDKKIIKVPQLEADDVLIMMAEKLSYSLKDYVVFSDDKDLRYYAPHYCKINITEEPSFCYDFYELAFQQMLAGDKEDNIDGIPNIGMVKARKILEKEGYSIESVIRVYKKNNIEIDNCLKQLVLTTPINSAFTTGYEYGFTDNITMNNILGHFRYFNNKVKEIYYEDKGTNTDNQKEVATKR